MKNLLKIHLTIAGAFLLSLLLLVRSCKNGGHYPHPFRTATPSLTLPLGDQAKVYVGEHQIAVVSLSTPKTTTYYVPDHANVDFATNGTVSVHVQQLGWERRPYWGVSFGDMPRIQVGCKVGYLHKVELGLGGGFATRSGEPLNNLIRLNINLSYAVYRNTSLFVGFEHTATFTGGILTKF